MYLFIAPICLHMSKKGKAYESFQTIQAHLPYKFI